MFEAGERVEHGWYQWVGMMLFGQSFTFYIGHFLWKSCEGRRVERLVSGNVSRTTFRTEVSLCLIQMGNRSYILTSS